MKRLSAVQYARAIWLALQSVESKQVPTLAERLFHQLRRRRMIRFIPRVNRELKRLSAKYEGKQMVEIEAADEKIAAEIIRKMPRSGAEVTINPKLLRGAAVTIDDRRVDASLSAELEQLRRHLLSPP